MKFGMGRKEDCINIFLKFHENGISSIDFKSSVLLLMGNAVYFIRNVNQVTTSINIYN